MFLILTGRRKCGRKTGKSSEDSETVVAESRRQTNVWALRKVLTCRRVLGSARKKGKTARMSIFILLPRRQSVFLYFFFLLFVRQVKQNKEHWRKMKPELDASCSWTHTAAPIRTKQECVRSITPRQTGDIGPRRCGSCVGRTRMPSQVKRWKNVPLSVHVSWCCVIWRRD